MDAELLELQRQFDAAQHAKSSIRLSERNVVELVSRLQESGIIDFELLHTTSGKEYITLDQLRVELENEINKLRRVSVIELADIIGVDLFHIERLTQDIVNKTEEFSLIQGEVISRSYWDSVAEEINERLQECSQIALAELASQLHVISELLATVLEARLGTIVKARMEGGQLYTPLYVARIGAMVRGAIRAITVPTNLSTVWSSLQQLLQEMEGSTGVSVEAAFFQSLCNGLLKEKEALGVLRAGTQWTPAVFAIAQRQSVESFFSQNSFIGYDVLHKLAIPQPKQYLQSRYSEGIPLESVFVHPSMVDMVAAATEDALENGSWIDCLSVLPSNFGYQDAARLLVHCPSIQTAIRNTKAIILCETCILSQDFVKNVFSELEKQLDTYKSSVQASFDILHSSSDAKSSYEPMLASYDTVGSKTSDKGSKKRKSKGSGSVKVGMDDDNFPNHDVQTAKSKKKQGKNKDSDVVQSSTSKFSTKKGHSKVRGEEQDELSEEWIAQKILELFPDLEGLGGGDDSNALVLALVMHLKPMLLASWRERKNAVLKASAEKRRQLVDSTQKKLDEAYLDLQLYEKALDLFVDDSSTSTVLHKHLLRTTAASVMDTLLHHLDACNKLENGNNCEETQVSDTTPLTSNGRISIAKSLPGLLSTKSLKAVEALEGKLVDTFDKALSELAEESGLSLRKLDKRLEKILLQSYCKDLVAQVDAENDPVALLPKVVSLLYLQVYNKALQAPGRAISAAVSRLKEKLDDSAFAVLSGYHTATVKLLALQAAAVPGEEENCNSDRTLSKLEFLESQIPALKALVSAQRPAISSNQ